MYAFKYKLKNFIKYVCGDDLYENDAYEVLVALAAIGGTIVGVSRGYSEAGIGGAMAQGIAGFAMGLIGGLILGGLGVLAIRLLGAFVGLVFVGGIIALVKFVIESFWGVRF